MTNENEQIANEQKTNVQTAPVVAIRDIVTFPNTIVPLYIGRPQSINAINTAFKEGQKLLL